MYALLRALPIAGIACYQNCILLV